MIEEISKATNQQTPVEEADRRSNDKIQVELQKILFDRYGYYYERKKGEFADGIRERYISRQQIIDRDTFLRICIACDFRPSFALRSSKQLFKESNFTQTLSNKNRADEYFFAYQCYLSLNEIEKTFQKDSNNPYGVVNFGQALRYGKYAVISVCNFYSKDNYSDPLKIVKAILAVWLKFEEYAIRTPTNANYFRTYVDQDTEERQRELNYAGYYKGKSLDKDLRNFFIELPLSAIQKEK